MQMDWYVLQVLTGSELEVCRQLRNKGFQALVLREICQIRRSGVWHQEERICLSGYVFVEINYTPKVHHTLKKIVGIIRLLPKDHPYPLENDDLVWLLVMGGEWIAPSQVDFSGNVPRIVDGPLLKLEQYITRLDRHRRRAQLRVPLLGEEKDMEFSIRPI